jgi:hypothetical protein
MTIDVPRTPRVSTGRRVGVYENEADITGLLWYRTHTIFDLPRARTKTRIGTAPDCDIVLRADGVSAHHCMLERRPRGLVVCDDKSRNGTAYEVGRVHGVALQPTFEDRRDTGEGCILAPGMTFALSTTDGEPYRLIALDDAMRRYHPALVEILGREDEVRFDNADIETPGPAALLLAADTPGHLLITGPRGCEHNELARIVYQVSRRRSQAFVPMSLEEMPTDRRRQSELVKDGATKGTLVIDVGTSSDALDPTFVSQLFSPAYEIRLIVLARTARHARDVLGEKYARPLLHVELAPVARRQAAIYRLLDQWLKDRKSVLRMDDLAEANLQALFRNKWRDNLTALREAAVKLDAIASAGFSRARAAEALQVSRQALDAWYNQSMGFEPELVSPNAKRAVLTRLAGRTPLTE